MLKFKSNNRCPSLAFGIESPVFGYNYGDGYYWSGDVGSGYGHGFSYSTEYDGLLNLEYHYPYELIIYERI